MAMLLALGIVMVKFHDAELHEQLAVAHVPCKPLATQEAMVLAEASVKAIELMGKEAEAASVVSLA
jgi:hypothetical protein